MLSPLPTPLAPPAAAPTTAAGPGRSPSSGNGGAPAGATGFAQALDRAQAPEPEASPQPRPAQARMQQGKGPAKAGPREPGQPAQGEVGPPTAEFDARHSTCPPERDGAEPRRQPASGVQDLLAQLQTTDPARAAALSGGRRGQGDNALGTDGATAAGAAEAWSAAAGGGGPGESGRTGAQRTGRTGSAHSLAALQGAQAALANQAASAAEDGLGRKGGVAAAGSERPAAAIESAAAPAAALAGSWAATASASGAPGSSAVPAQARQDAPPGSPTFAHQLGAQLTTFVLDGVQHARLHLNPAEMGPVSVQIQLDGHTAVVHLGAEQAHTRQALEQALPQLASQLSEAGLTLTGGGVFEHTQQGRQGMGAGEDRDGGRAAGRSPDPWGPGSPDRQDEVALGTTRALQRRGVVDLVA
jgi:flagellar hook-length control protein FliK